MRKNLLVVGLLVLGFAAPAAAQGAAAKAQQDALRPARDGRAEDSLRRVLARHPRDTHGTKALVALMFQFQYHDTARAGRYGRQALALATAIGDRRRVARVGYNLATLAAQGGEPDKSVRLHLQSARAFLALGNGLWAGHNYANAAKRRTGEGRYLEAMQLSLRGLRLRQAAHDTGAVADSYGTIGQIYLDQQNLPAAQVAYEQSLRGWQHLRVPSYVIHSLNQLAVIHRDAGRFGPARARLAEALAIVKTQADTSARAGLLLTLAVLEQRQGHWAASVPLLRRVEAGYAAYEAGNVTPGALSDLYSILGQALVQTGQAAAAAPYLRQALALARASHDRQEEADALEGLADLAAARADYRAAFDYHRRLELLKDTLRLATTTRTVAELQTQYETEKKEAQNRLQASQLAVQQQVIGRRNVQLGAGAAVAALLLLVGGLLFNRHRLRLRVAHEQERLAQSRAAAAAVLGAEAAERQRIGQDLHDGVGQVLTAAKLNLEALKDQYAPAGPGPLTLLQNALELVNESFVEVRQISHNLMPNALIKRGLAQAVRDFLGKVSPDGRLKINLEVVGLDSGGRLPPNVENVLFRVIQELVQNIVKHARATAVTLQLVRGAAELTLLVEDNGVGFDPAALDPETGGIGLKNIESRLEYLGGSAHFDSRPGHGTTATATVPLA